MMPLRIGTRSSPLALWQAHHVADRLAALGQSPPEIVHIQTEGDRDQNSSLAHIGGQGVFTKEIQRALLDGRVDVAVHSLKDLPTWPVDGLTLAAVPARGPWGDALVSRTVTRFEDLPPNARVATGSLRRRSQLAHRRPDLKLVDLRGNVQTRLQKLDDHGWDAIMLAEAGLVRLGLVDRIATLLDPAWMLPAVGQGALGLECRADDATTFDALRGLNDPATHAAVDAERAFLLHLGGGCQVPIAAFATVTGDRLTLRGAVLSPDGRERRDGEESGNVADAEQIGQRLAIALQLPSFSDAPAERPDAPLERR